MGYCGAGTEKYLGVLDISKKKPVKIAAFHIASCDENIELDDSNNSAEDEFGAFSVNSSNQLEMKFSFYDDRSEESPRAILFDDFKKLRFVKTPAPACK